MAEPLYLPEECAAAQGRLRQAGVTPCPGTISQRTIEAIYKVAARAGDPGSTVIRVLLEEREILLGRLAARDAVPREWD
jgi:hypothetical protein